MRNNQDELTGIANIGLESTAHKAIEERALKLALYDALTGFPNRLLLFERIAAAKEANIRKGRYGALIYLDLDNFKPLNDAHGLAAGDLLLVEAAKRIKSCLRKIDAVSRLEGDKFIVLLDEITEDRATSTTKAKTVAEKIRCALALPYLLQTSSGDATELKAIEHQCTASIGIAIFSGMERSGEDIFKSADIAMRQAKNSGRNLIRVHGEA